jgi:hypothetical protein
MSQKSAQSSRKSNPPKVRRKQKQALTPEIKADIAIARLSGFKHGRITPMKEMERRFGHDRAVISKATVDAFRNRLVEVRKRERAVEPQLDPDLRDALLSKYSKLQHVDVIKSRVTAGDDTELHRELGMAMANFIAVGPVVQKGDVFGIGSGRGVEMTINALQHFGRLRAQNVTLMSLTGSVYSTPRATTKGLWLDADRHVIEFAKHFELIQEPTQYLICHPIAHETPIELKKARQRVWLGSAHAPQLSHVLVGVGRFGVGHHRFYVEATAGPNDQEPFLMPIHTGLVQLKLLCERAVSHFPKGRAPYYSPAAEMSNFFFYVPPPRGLQIPNEKAIIDCIADINSRLLTIKENQIRNTLMLVVAGTREKAHAVRALLESEAYPVTYLCTDTAAAHEIYYGGA